MGLGGRLFAEPRGEDHRGRTPSEGITGIRVGGSAALAE